METTTEQPTANTTQDQNDHIKGVIESLLFVNEKPVTLDQIRNVLGAVTGGEAKKIITRLQQEHEERKSGIMIIEIAGGYQMLSNPLYAPYLKSFFKTKHKEKLSKPALESMAIIAYKQPVTRADIEVIRGVNSDGVVGHLLSKELIKIVGRKDVPGRPYVYGTTKQFLEYFGLKSLEDLPVLEEFADLQDASQAGILKEGYEDGPAEAENNEVADTGSEPEENPEEQDVEPRIEAEQAFDGQNEEEDNEPERPAQ